MRVMLSNEAAVGNYPVEAVATMAKIADRIDREKSRQDYTSPKNSETAIPNAISQAVGHIATQLKAKAILTFTKTGSTGRNVSKYRPDIPILAVTPHAEVARQLQMVWGVQPLLVLNLPSIDETLQASLNIAQEKGLVEAGDLVVITAGTLQGVAGSTDFIKVELVTAVMGKGVGVGQGSVSGLARLATTSSSIKGFNRGDILVASATDARHVEAIRKAAGIITEVGGMTSHAAVLGLRLRIPVIVGVEDATRIIRDGTHLTLDVKKGLVYSGTMTSGLLNLGTRG